MPNRMIRDEILESERVLSLPADVRWFFLSVILTADDLGLFEATEFKLARRATTSPEQAGRYLQMLADADLVRLYTADGKRYGFVPRFRQRVQIKRAKHPLPLLALLRDDLDAVSKFNDLTRDPTDGYPMGNSCTSDAQPSEAEPEAKEGIVSSTSTRSQTLAAPTGGRQPKPPMPDCPHRRILELWAEVLPALPQHNPDLWDGSRASNLRARWRETAAKRGWTSQDDGIRYFRRLFGYIGQSPFLTGQRPAREPGGTPFQATLEFVVTASKWRRLLEGSYHAEEVRA